MNIQTVKYISQVAGFAKDQMLSGKTLKWAKGYVAECLEEATTPLESDYVDFDAVKLTLSILVGENRKERFAFNASGIVLNMFNKSQLLVAVVKVSPSIVETVKQTHKFVANGCSLAESAVALTANAISPFDRVVIMQAFDIKPASKTSLIELQTAIKVIIES